MPQPVAVAFVHGIFNQDLNFAGKMQDALRDALPKGQKSYMEFESVEWAGTVRARQDDLMAKVRADHAGVVDNKLRRFVIGGLGDAAAYQKTKHPANSSYRDIQNRVSDTLNRLGRHRVKDRPLVFIGHSLGCHIISSFSWDLNKLKQRTEADIKSEPDGEVRQRWTELQAASPFLRLDTFAGFVTLGSNMPLFTFAFPPDDVQPITSAPPDAAGRSLAPAFPGVKLKAPLLDQARWLNFFSNRDLLGFPLKPLYHAFDMSRLEDICVRSESLTSRSVPYLSFLSAHVGYWTNKTVIQRTAKLISDIIG
jgi:hypothetical protein